MDAIVGKAVDGGHHGDAVRALFAQHALYVAHHELAIAVLPVVREVLERLGLVGVEDLPLCGLHLCLLLSAEITARPAAVGPIPSTAALVGPRSGFGWAAQALAGDFAFAFDFAFDERVVPGADDFRSHLVPAWRLAVSS